MRASRPILQILALCAVGSVVNSADAQVTQDARLTYQGELLSSQTPFSGVADFRFTLFGSSSGGNALTPTVQADGVLVSVGRFSVPIDFGATAFQGQQAWLEIAVRAPAGTGAFVTLGNRQQITTTPYAGFALDAGRLGGQAPAFFTNATNLSTGTLANARLAPTIARTDIAQTFTGALTLSNPSNVVAGNGSLLQALNASSIATGTIADARLSGNVARLDTTNTWTGTSNTFTGELYATTAQVNDRLLIRGAEAGAFFSRSAAAPNFWKLSTQANAGAAGDDFQLLRYRNSQFAGLNLVVKNDSGNVGVGVDNPVVAMDVAGRIGTRAGVLELGRDASPGNNFHVTNDTNSGLRALRIWNGNYGSGLNLLTVAQDGNVGIGTSAPGSGLEIRRPDAGAGFAAGISLVNSAPSGGFWSFRAIANPNPGIIEPGSLAVSNGFGLIALMTQSMKVGIGSVFDPQHTLDVGGTVRSRSGGFVFPDGSIMESASVAVAEIPFQAWFSSSGSWTVPAGATRVRFRVWAGGGASSTRTTNPGGGGSGAFAQTVIAGLVPGEVFQIVVGSGGTAGASGSESRVIRVNGAVVVADANGGGGAGGGVNGGVGGSTDAGQVRLPGSPGEPGANGFGGDGGTPPAARLQLDDQLRAGEGGTDGESGASGAVLIDWI